MSKSPYLELIGLIGLPEEMVKKELGSLSAKDSSLEQSSLEDLRELAAEYLQNTFSELKDELG